MEIVNSIILGIIQGLTEFWPISSSGHLVAAHQIFSINFASELGFDVALHLGTLLALVVFFYKDIAKYILAFSRSLANWNLKNDLDQRLSWYILVGTLPAGIAGYFVADLAETAFRNLWLIASLLIIIGLLFFIMEKYSAKVKDLDQLSWQGSFLIGMAQAIALIPGVSRSGITIVTGLFLGLKRQVAARYSFLLSIPIVFGAGLKKIYDLAKIGLSSHQWGLMAVGFFVSALVGYLAIRFLLKFLANHTLKVFGYYRIALGIIIILILIFNI